MSQSNGMLLYSSYLHPEFRCTIETKKAELRDLLGNLVRLSDTSLPRKEKNKDFGLDVLSEEEKEKIQQVIDDKEKKTLATLSPDDDKDHRRLVHRTIRENFDFLGKVIDCCSWEI